jgi:hypothetical protein
MLWTCGLRGMSPDGARSIKSPTESPQSGDAPRPRCIYHPLEPGSPVLRCFQR